MAPCFVACLSLPRTPRCETPSVTSEMEDCTLRALTRLSGKVLEKKEGVSRKGERRGGNVDEKSGQWKQKRHRAC